MNDGNVAIEKGSVAHSCNCPPRVCQICVLLTHLFYFSFFLSCLANSFNSLSYETFFSCCLNGNAVAKDAIFIETKYSKC